MLKRSALLGGALVWTTPVVQSVGGAALADTTSPGGGAPSYTLLVFKCGAEYYKAKIGQTGDVDCGANGGNGPSQTHAKLMVDEQLAGTGLTWDTIPNDGCPGSLSASVDASGLVVTHNGCSIVAWSVHDGAGNGCGQVSFGPDNRGVPAYAPAIGGGQSVFPKPVVTTCPTEPAGGSQNGNGNGGNGGGKKK